MSGYYFQVFVLFLIVSYRLISLYVLRDYVKTMAGFCSMLICLVYTIFKAFVMRCIDYEHNQEQKWINIIKCNDFVLKTYVDRHF